MSIYTKSLISVLIFIALSCHNATAKIKPVVSISIASASLSIEKPVDTVDIILKTDGSRVGGVDLKFGFDSPAFNLVTVIQGEIPDSCGWKVFNSREGIESGQDNFPRKLWQVLAMAEFGPDTLRAECHGFDRAASIARLVIAIDSTRAIKQSEDSVYSVYFFWADCSDNTVTDVKGEVLFISEEVDGLHSTDPSVVGARFPTHLGASSKCINPSAKNPPQRKVGFSSGMVRVRTVVDNE